MPHEDYMKALKAGRKDYHLHLSRGEYPYLQVLDEITSFVDIVSEVNLGLVQIPTELIAGTKSVGRRTAFAPNFMPLLEPKTEFSAKWTALYDSHISEGIHTPVIAYEFMNRFYIMEGNKRVSVLKYVSSPTVPAIVTRMVPRRTGETENKIYYEFMEFYRLSGSNSVWFSREGSFAKLAALVSADTLNPWDEETRSYFNAAFSRFQTAFRSRGGDRLPITEGDALLTYLNIFGYDTFKTRTLPELKEDLGKLWDELLINPANPKVELSMEPAESEKKNLLNLLIPTAPRRLRITFIHTGNEKESSWIYAHELGRRHLDQVFREETVTFTIPDVEPAQADEAIRRAVDEGSQVIFTTSPELLGASLKAAAEFPEMKILNCSLNTPHKLLRTYYGRMYEAKYLCGAIAGAMAENGRIGYVADCPIYGAAANINAFALGALLTNPRAKIFLEWSSLKDHDVVASLREKKISLISSQDMITPIHASRQFGLYNVSGESPVNLATPLWHWGKFYEKIIRSILSGSWKSQGFSDSGKAINYWWGMSSGVVDAVYSKSLPASTRRLVEYLRRGLISSSFHPFEGVLISQNGAVQEDESHRLTPMEIITMNWLAENVEGRIPLAGELKERTQPLMELQGIKP